LANTASPNFSLLQQHKLPA